MLFPWWLRATERTESTDLRWRNSFKYCQYIWLLPSSSLSEDESLLIYLTAVFSNWNGGGEFCISKELCSSAFLRSSQVRLLTLLRAAQVWHLTLAFPPRAVFKEQVQLNNLTNSSQGSTAFWFWASVSGHQALDRIRGVSGIKHIMKIIISRSPRAFLPTMEIKMIMSLTCKVPIFYIIIIFNNNYLVIIQITPFLWEIQWALLTLIV